MQQTYDRSAHRPGMLVVAHTGALLGCKVVTGVASCGVRVTQAATFNARRAGHGRTSCTRSLYTYVRHIKCNLSTTTHMNRQDHFNNLHTCAFAVADKRPRCTRCGLAVGGRGAGDSRGVGDGVACCKKKRISGVPPLRMSYGNIKNHQSLYFSISAP
jgi:hypothetical protein